VKVVVPYTNLRAPTAAIASAVAATFVETATDDAYWKLLRDLWAKRQTFIILEHDIVPPEGALEAIWACPRDWCGVPYPVGRIWGVWHGCTKFGRDLIRRYPEAVRSMRVHSWDALDAQLIDYIQRRQKERAHWHWPAALHLNETSVPQGMVFANCGDCGGPLRWEDLREGPQANRCPKCGRIPSYFREVEPAVIMRRRSDLATSLIYVGRGGYLNGVPAADFESDDEALVTECLDSGLYVRADTRKAAEKAAIAEAEAEAAAAAKALEDQAKAASAGDAKAEPSKSK
jgi:hypothetical protein